MNSVKLPLIKILNWSKIYEQAACFTIGPFHLGARQIFYNRWKRSFVVDSKNDASAEQTLVWKSKVGVVVILNVPETLACYTHTLALNFADHSLNNDFVWGDGWRFQGCPDLVNDVFRPPLGAGVVVLLALEVALDHLLDTGSNLAWVESKNLKLIRYLSFSLGSSL